MNITKVVFALEEEWIIRSGKSTGLGRLRFEYRLLCLLVEGGEIRAK